MSAYATVDALKELYTALGGENDVTDVTMIPDMIKIIAGHLSAGGAAELPTVGSDDNGKILRVVNGAWAAAAAELPAVTASNNGSVLKVADGAWAIGTDNTGT